MPTALSRTIVAAISAPLNRRRLSYLKPGESNHKFADADDDELMLPCHRRLSANGTPGFGDVYTWMRPDRPSPTITTRFHSVSNGRFGHYDPDPVRAISLREGAALQSFPDDYEFHASGMDGAAQHDRRCSSGKLSQLHGESLT